MRDLLDTELSQLSGIRRGLVLGGMLTIILWLTWLYFAGASPRSWWQIALPIFAASFLLDAYISLRRKKHREAAILMACFLGLAATTIYAIIHFS